MATSQRVRGPLRFAVDVALLLALPAVAVAAVYLSIYASKRFAFPVGYDTPKYLWRTALVGSNGVTSLAGAAPAPFRSNPDRAGFPVLIGAVSSLLRVSVPHLVIVLPGVMAAVIGLGAGAFSRLALGLPRWAVPVFVLGVGVSPNVSRIAGPGYNDNLLVAGLCMSAATVAVVAAASPARRASTGADGSPAATSGTGSGGLAATIGGIVLLTAGVLTHWIFVALFGVVLLAVAAIALPASVRTWRGSRRPFETPSGRLATIVGGSAILGGIGLLTLVGSEPNPPRLPRSTFVLKLRGDVPRYVFPFTGVLAAIGAAFVWPGRPGLSNRPNRGAAERRAGYAPTLGGWLCLMWALTAAAGVVLLAVGASVPAHRFLAFDLGIPLLAAAGIVGLGTLVASHARRAGRALAIALVVVALAGTTTVAYRAWSGTHPWISPKQFEQSSVAGTYLQRVGGTRPVVFIVDLGGAAPLSSTSAAFHVIRTGLAPQDITRTYEYLGSAEEFLAGRPTLRAAPPTFDEASLRLWPSVRAVLDRHPIAVLMRAFHRGYGAIVAAHPDWRVAPGVAVVQGPRPPGDYPPLQPVPVPLPAPWLAALWVAFVAVLSIAGAGWTAALVRAGWVERLALSPAFGIATIVLGGILVDPVGVRTTGVGGAMVVVAVAVCGWVVFAVGERRRRRASGLWAPVAATASAATAEPLEPGSGARP